MLHLTAVARSLPRTYWARNPPTNASPAPFVSTILLAGSFSAENSTTVPFSAQTTGSEPWVMITVLPLLPFSLGNIEIARAIFFTSVVPRLKASANVAASVSFPKTMSAYGMTDIIWSLKNWMRKGAERLRQ